MRTQSEKSIRVFLLCVAAIAAVLAYHRPALADSFENLDFESAQIGKPVNYQLPASQALPFWAADNGYPANVGYDTLSIGSTMISLQDGLNPYHSGVPMYPLQGQYSVLLQTGRDIHGVTQDAWISQTGDVPSDARSLLFETDTTGLVGATIGVSMNGVPIPVSLYSVGPTVNANYGPIKTFIGDISVFAGQQDVALRFEAVPPAGLRSCNMDLDAITFSSIVVPEPSAFVLLAIGVLTACIFRLRRRRPSEV